MNEKQGVKWGIYKNLKPFFSSFFYKKAFLSIFFVFLQPHPKNKQL